jgi:hypothetical protein
MSKIDKTNISQDLAISPPKPVQIRHPKKRLFIEHLYNLNGNVSAVCKITQISRDTYYHWLKTDNDFNRVIQEQKLQALDEYDQILRNKAKTERGTTELIFFLKTHHPEYKETREQIAFKQGDSQWVLSRG